MAGGYLPRAAPADFNILAPPSRAADGAGALADGGQATRRAWKVEGNQPRVAAARGLRCYQVRVAPSACAPFGLGWPCELTHSEDLAQTS